MYLALSGGGISGISFIGAYRSLLEHGHAFRGFVGTSIGAVFSVLFSIGLGYDELLPVAEKFKYSHVEDLQVLGLLENLGLDRGRNIEKFIRSILLLQTGSADLTFIEHYALTGKTLQITTFCVDDDQTVVLNVWRTPNLPVYKAVMMSISIPWLIASVKWQNKTYIDGGFHDPFPITLLPPENTIGLKLNNSKISASTESGFINFTVNLVSSLLHRSHAFARTDHDKYNIITIDTGIQMLDISLSREAKLALVNMGYTAVTKALNDSSKN